MNPWIWKRLFSFATVDEEAVPFAGKVEIFSRHCRFSSISAHKKRFQSFTRERCNQNLLETLNPEKANLTYWFDGSGSGEHFLDHVYAYPVVKIDAGSEASSFLQLLDYVEKQNYSPETVLYFVEDDYLHKKGWIDILLEGIALPGVDYVTLYDHRDKYFLPMYQKLQSRIFLSPSTHWRTVPSTTHTFAVKWKVLQRDLPFHRLFSNGRKISADHKKFSLLTRLGRTLISPIPGWSTHAEPEFASPFYDWETSLQEPQKCEL